MLGVVSPVGDQGGDIAKTAAIEAGLPDTVAGVQLNRFCASGLEAVNLAAQKVRSGWEDLVLAGGVESMSRVPMGSDGGAWAMDPETELRHRLRAAGHRRRPDRDDRGLHPRRRRRVRRRVAGTRAAKAWANGYFANSVVPVKDLNGLTVLDHDEFIRPGTTVESARPASSRRSPTIGEHGRLRRRGAAEVPLGREDRPRPPRRQLLRASSTAPRWWRSATSRSAPTSA